MDYRRIEDLLEKYWSCETSIEEEEELRAFYTKQEIPEPFSRFKTLFIYQKKEKETGLNNAFDQKILRKIEQSTKRQFFPPTNSRWPSFISRDSRSTLHYYPTSDKSVC